MISQVETQFRTLDEAAIARFAADECHILRALLATPQADPDSAYHRFQVFSDDLIPAHVEWLDERLDGWALVEHMPDRGFCFWFTDGSDAADFEQTFL